MTDIKRITKGLYWDRAWALVEGCTPVSAGCQNCWSAKQTHMRAQQQNEKIRDRYAGLTDKDGKWNGQIRLVEKNLDLPLRTRKPTVFAIWNDLFHEDVPDGFIYSVLQRIDVSFNHIFLLLTKRPKIMKGIIEDWYAWKTPDGEEGITLPNNLWIGVTAENQGQADKRIPILLQIPAAVRFVNVEPMLGPVDLSIYMEPEINKAMFNPEARCGHHGNLLDGKPCPLCFPERLNWIICGGETGPGARPMHPKWVRSLRNQCQSAGVHFFFKGWGEYALAHLLEPHTKIDFGDGALHCMKKVGKKKAGRLIDGREWDELPKMGDDFAKGKVE